MRAKHGGKEIAQAPVTTEPLIIAPQLGMKDGIGLFEDIRNEAGTEIIPQPERIGDAFSRD